MHRREIKGVTYNPRVIDDFAKARLKKKLETRGLLNALVVNVHPKCMGNLVSGHQRLAILDALEGTDDYLLDVDAVNLTPKQEREENVHFNFKGTQGDWDLEKLADLAQSDDFSFEHAGFTEMDIALTFEGTEFATIFSPEEQAPEVAESMAVMEEMAPHGRMENGEAIRDPEAHKALIEERERMRAKMKAANEARDSEFYVVVVCKDREQRESLMAALGHDPNDKLIDATELAFKCKLPLASGA